MKRNVYSGWMKLFGEEHPETLREGINYALGLINLKRFKEAKSLLRRTIPVMQRILGESHADTLRMRWIYAQALYTDTGATLDHLREAVSTFEDMEPIARRVLGSAHPLTLSIENGLRRSRAALRACETPSPPGNA